mmetsp:Transcript_5353/g.12474  ORF Transcript_5353/g.12474 Transcript_5353/m.12474 type:complete len:210 (+) Transcript_5353:1153-1782(+)
MTAQGKIRESLELFIRGLDAAITQDFEQQLAGRDVTWALRVEIAAAQLIEYLGSRGAARLVSRYFHRPEGLARVDDPPLGGKLESLASEELAQRIRVGLDICGGVAVVPLKVAQKVFPLSGHRRVQHYRVVPHFRLAAAQIDRGAQPLEGYVGVRTANVRQNVDSQRSTLEGGRKESRESLERGRSRVQLIRDRDGNKKLSERRKTLPH